MVRSIPLFRRRVLLRGPSCKVWYLGERIRAWREGAWVRRPPLAPPRYIFWAHLLDRDELESDVEGEDTDEHCKRRKSYYMDFAQAHLLQRVLLPGSTSQVNNDSTKRLILHFYLQISFT